MTELDYGDIVRLKHDPHDDELRKGDCGIVWAIYDFQPVMYEATFFNRQEQGLDLMFTEDEVELLKDFEETPFPEQLRETRQILIPAFKAY